LKSCLLRAWAIYYGYLYFRERGRARKSGVITGLAIVFLTLTLLSTLPIWVGDRLDRSESSQFFCSRAGVIFHPS